MSYFPLLRCGLARQKAERACHSAELLVWPRSYAPMAGYSMLLQVRRRRTPVGKP